MLYRYHRSDLCAALATCLLFPISARAWGDEGHDIVAAIAIRELTPQVAVQVQALLGAETLTDVASWADQVRQQKEYRWTAPLHYVNLPPGSAAFDFPRDCPTGECVVGAIHRFVFILRNPTADRAKKAEALKFLVHFVGDIHQPLHVSYARDRGGNDIKVEFSYDRTDLHTVWDSLLLSQARKPWREHAAELYARITPELRRKWSTPLDPAAWASESFKLAESHAYAIPKDGQLDRAYLERNLPVVEARLAMAGVRLGALLNAIFTDGQGLPTSPPVTTRPAATQPVAVTAPAITQPAPPSH